MNKTDTPSVGLKNNKIEAFEQQCAAIRHEIKGFEPEFATLVEEIKDIDHKLATGAPERNRE